MNSSWLLMLVYNGVELTLPFAAGSSLFFGLNYLLQETKPECLTYTQFILDEQSYWNLVIESSV